MELKIQIDKIDYGSIAEQAIPAAIQRLNASHSDSRLAAVLQKLGGAPGGAARAMLNVLPQEMKDQVAAALLESYRDELTGLINEFAARKGLDITITDVELKP